ncbi:MAG: hypothetical protein EA381_10090 [Planctomycetaceae bacterium]|nr:MAG: hypothetical protein EA381_10090 [Planctomycetaceae bacterium]
MTWRTNDETIRLFSEKSKKCSPRGSKALPQAPTGPVRGLANMHLDPDHPQQTLTVLAVERLLGAVITRRREPYQLIGIVCHDRVISLLFPPHPIAPRGG